MAGTAGYGHHATTAAEWLIDNYHLVAMQIREIGVDLPPRSHVHLPRLAKGPAAGLPRVSSAAWSLVAHMDSRLDPNPLRHYLPPSLPGPATVTNPFAVQIAHRLRGHDPRTDPALAWLDRHREA